MYLFLTSLASNAGNTAPLGRIQKQALLWNAFIKYDCKLYMCCMRFLPTISPHHVDLFTKLLYSKKLFIIYSLKFKLHQVKCWSLNLWYISKVVSAYNRPTSFFKWVAFFFWVLPGTQIQYPGENKYRYGKATVSHVCYSLYWQCRGLWIIASGSLMCLQRARIRLNEALNNSSFSVHR